MKWILTGRLNNKNILHTTSEGFGWGRMAIFLMQRMNTFFSFSIIGNINWSVYMEILYVDNYRRLYMWTMEIHGARTKIVGNRLYISMKWSSLDFVQGYSRWTIPDVFLFIYYRVHLYKLVFMTDIYGTGTSGKKYIHDTIQKNTSNHVGFMETSISDPRISYTIYYIL